MTISQATLIGDEDSRVSPPILVVDDSRAQRHLLAKALSKVGYATIEAASGEEAVALCRDRNVEIVVSDWMMPGMSGVEFCRTYRGLRGELPGYFILLTAQTEREALVEGLESGADDFLSKPFHTVELKARIRAGERVVAAHKDVLSKKSLLSSTLDELQRLYDALDRDLIEARSFQEALIPERHHKLSGADISLYFRPSGHVGGDLVGLFRISDTRYGVYAVDVSGHGVASALMTARVAGYFNPMSPEQNIALDTDGADGWRMLPPDKVCEKLNSILLSEMETDTYLTMLLANVDLGTGHVVMSQAGHPSPAIQSSDGSVRFASAFGMPIGLVEGAEFSSTDFTLAPGDRVLLYSDGITECPLQGDEMLEEEGLAEMLSQHSEKRGNELLEALVGDLSARTGIKDFPDDLSCALIEMTG